MFNATLIREVKDRHRVEHWRLKNDLAIEIDGEAVRDIPVCHLCHQQWPCDAARLADAYETLLLTTQPSSPSVGSVTVSSTGTCDCQICRP